MKKILSIALVLVLALSVMVMPASAGSWNNGPDGVVKFTFSAEKYSGVDTMGVEASDIYAVTMYINSTAPITDFTVPVYYDATKFTPVDGTDMSILDWGYTVDHAAGLNGVAYEIPAGSDLADTNKYNKANVAAANRVVNARGAIKGLGQGAFTSSITNLTDTDKSVSTVWWGGLDTDKYGVIVLQYSPQSGFCNLQAYGEATPFLTFLFKLNAGADPNGAEFGFIEGSTREYDVVTETVATKFYYDGTSTVGYPNVEATSCIFEEAKEPSPVFNNKSQIRFNAAPVGDAKADFDVRTRGYISAAELEALCGGNVTEGAITDVGFVYFAGEDIDLATAAEVAKNGDSGSYVRKQCKYVQNAGTEYRWTCLVTDSTYGGTLQSVAYITVGGETYITDAAQETSFADLYDRNINSYLGA